MKQRKRTNRTESRTNRRQTIQNLAANQAANGTMTGEVPAVPIAEAARRWGVDARTVRRWCDEGRVNSFLTPGRHRRISLAEIERIQRGDTGMKQSSNGRGQTSVSSPTLQFRKENLEEMRLMMEERKARGALRELERAEQKDTEQERAEEEQAQEERRAREAEQARRDRELEARERQQEEAERRQFWIDEQVEFALRSVPPEIAGRFASEIQLSVEEALQGLGPSRPKTIVERVVHSAVQQVVQPFLQEQRRKQEIAIAANDSLYVPGSWAMENVKSVRESGS